ncbi:replication endonuclease [Providencia hangzhouensis]|uniref:replication endonuclease n=1 Tax=Providencia hangzhouensis TaxID=3031799 RepID=UPI0034DCD888
MTYSTKMDYPYSWNKPEPNKYYKAGIDFERPLTPEQRGQAQAILIQLRSLPRFLSSRFERIYNNKTRIDGINKGQAYLYFEFYKTLWPRLSATQARYQIPFGECATNIPVFALTPDIEQLNYLPDLNSKALKRLAKNLATGFYSLYEKKNQDLVTRYDGDNEVKYNHFHQSIIYGEMAALSLLLHVTPSHYQTYAKHGVLKLKQIYSAMARLVSADFWERRLKEHRTRWIESLSIAAMLVNCNSTPYVSKRGVKAVISQKLNNLRYLKTMDIEDEATGKRSDLYEKVEKSTSNPINRYNELMTMTRGIEDIADFRKDIGLFLTLTCPSKFHATSKSIKGKQHKDKKLNKYTARPNENWVDPESDDPTQNARTVKDAQRYLTHVWALIRTALNDKNIKFYGVRTVEPHHDSTPHWHILLFTSPDHRQTVIDTCKQKALAEDGDEKGAQKHRFEVKDMEKGKATGYIAKYISKCIPGQHKGAEAMKNDVDIETGLNVHPKTPDEIPAPDRIAAWASIWRIRQFQSFGIPSKGVYRECRRLRALGKKSLRDEFGDVAERVRAAADRGNFAEYILTQGGPCTPLPEQTLRVAREKVEKPNDYGEFRKKAIGLYSPLDATRPVLNTYPKKYRIVPKKAVSADAHKSGVMPLERAIGEPWSTVNNCRSDFFEVAKNVAISEPEPTLTASNDLPTDGDLAFYEIAPPCDQGTPKGEQSKRRLSTLSLTEKESLLRPMVHQFLEKNGVDIPQDTFIDQFIKGMRISTDDLTYWFDGKRIQQHLNEKGVAQLKQKESMKKHEHEKRINAVLTRVNQSKKQE